MIKYYRDLKKENNKLERLLSTSNKVIFTDIIIQLRQSKVYEEYIEEIRQDLLGMFLQSQNENKEIHELLGQDLDSFCKEIIENTPKKSKLESFVYFTKIFSFGFFFLIITHILVSKNIGTLIHTHTPFNDPLMISIRSIALFLILYFSTAISNFFINKKLSHQKSGRNKNAFFIGASVAIITFITFAFIDNYSYGFVSIHFSTLLIVGILSLIIFFGSILIEKSLKKKSIKYIPK